MDGALLGLMDGVPDGSSEGVVEGTLLGAVDGVPDG